MKLEKRHLNYVLVLLLVIVAYNVYRFTRSTTPPAPTAPMLAGVRPPANAPGSAQAAPVDPTKIPAPPAVALSPDPAWGRDPFLGAGESRKASAAAVVPVTYGADPVVQSILFSPTRKVALVDKRLVTIGDTVSSGVVSDIERDAIVVKTASGQTRRVPMGRPGQAR